MYARFILKLRRWFGLLDSDICKWELFTINNFKVERFSCNLPILVLSAAYHLKLPAYHKHPQMVQPQPIGSTGRWRLQRGHFVAGNWHCWGHRSHCLADSGALAAPSSRKHAWFSLAYVISNNKALRIWKWEGRPSIKDFPLAVLSVSIMLKHRWEQTLPASSSARRHRHTALGKEASRPELGWHYHHFGN